MRDVLGTAKVAAGHETVVLLHKERPSVTLLRAPPRGIARGVLSAPSADDEIMARGGTVGTVYGGSDASEA